MKLKYVLPSGIDAINVEFDEEKREITMDLIFYGDGKGKCVGGVVQTLDSKDEVLFSGIVEVSGQSAKASVTDRTKPVVPVIERSKKG